MTGDRRPPARRAVMLSSLGVAGLLLIGLIAAQILLPRVAADRVRGDISPYGKVENISVHAFPAVSMLWGDVGTVDVKIGRMRLDPEDADGLLADASEASEVHADIASLAEESLRLGRVRLEKQGGSFSGKAMLTSAALRASLPSGVRVRLLGSHEGEVDVMVTGSFFGIVGSEEVRILADEGDLIAEAASIPIPGLAGMTLFESPSVEVEGIYASEMRGPSGRPTYQVRLEGGFT